MGYSLDHIRVGSRKIGLVGLKEVFAAVCESQLTDEPQIIETLLTHARLHNYIPAAAEEEYGAALFRAYRRSLGETVPETPGVLEIRVYGGH